MQDDVDGFSVTGEGFVHRVVDYFLRQVIGAGGVGVHAGAFFTGSRPVSTSISSAV